MEITKKKPSPSNWAERSLSGPQPTESSQETTQFHAPSVTGNAILVAYNTLPGNRPNSYGNYVAIWQNHNSIPWNTPPLKVQKIVDNTPSGSMTFGGLDITQNSYILGYSVGPELSSPHQPQGNICSTVFVPESGGSTPTSENSQPSLTYIPGGSTSVSVNFNNLPSGILPQTNGAWIGIWQGSQASYNNPPMASNSVQVDSSEGTAFINGVNIRRGWTYTIALFMSGWIGEGKNNDQHPMACTVTFTN